MEILIVTGMSGAGKSNAANALEDLGYYLFTDTKDTLDLFWINTSIDYFII